MNPCLRGEFASGGGSTRLSGSSCEPAFDTRQVEQGPRLGRAAPVRSPSHHGHQRLSRWCLRGLAHRWGGACSGQPLGDLPWEASPECQDHRIGLGLQQRCTAVTGNRPCSPMTSQDLVASGMAVAGRSGCSRGSEGCGFESCRVHGGGQRREARDQSPTAKGQRSEAPGKNPGASRMGRAAAKCGA